MSPAFPIVIDFSRWVLQCGDYSKNNSSEEQNTLPGAKKVQLGSGMKPIAQPPRIIPRTTPSKSAVHLAVASTAFELRANSNSSTRSKLLKI